MTDHTGPGELLVVGRTDGGVNNTSLGLGPASGCRKITIEPGAKVTVSGPGIPSHLRELVVNGTLELVVTGTDGVVMRDGHLLAGTGTVRIVGSRAANADLRKAGNDLKIIAIPR